MKKEKKTEFCTKSYTQEEKIEIVKKILLVPNLYNELKKYNETPDPNKEKYLTKLKHKAYKQWHSDVRTTKDPNAEFYSKCVSEALNVFTIIATNLDLFIDPISKNINIPEEQDNQDATFAEMMEKLRNNIDKIFEKAEKTTETVVINEGTLYRDIIEEERDAKTWEPSFYALLFYAFAGIPVVLIGAIFENAPPIVANTISFILISLYMFIILICFIGMIPFSRYWLFSLNETFEDICITIINTGSTFLEKTIMGAENLLNKNIKKALEINKPNKIFSSVIFKLFFLFYIWSFRLMMFVFGLIMSVLYGIALMIVGNKRFKNIVKEQTYYDGVADWYLYELFSKSEKDLSHEDKNIIYYFYNKYL